MRFFIALEVPDTNREELRNIQNRLAQIIPEAVLTDSDKLHITLVFLGEHSPDLKDKLIELITYITRDIPPFQLTPAYIDGFPNLHNAHILWCGVKDDVDKLFLLRERLKDGLEKIGLFVDERRYTPHIAIAKVKNFELNNAEEQQLQQISFLPLSPINIESIKLFESIPSLGLHSHNTLAEIKLKL